MQGEPRLGELPDSPVRTPASPGGAGSIRRHASLPASDAPDTHGVEMEVISPAASALNIAAQIAKIKASSEQVSASRSVLVRYHREIKTLLASFESLSVLTPNQRDEITQLEGDIQSGQIIEREQKELLQTLAMPPSSAKKARTAATAASHDKPSVGQWAVAIGGTGGGLLAKGVAWNLNALLNRIRAGEPVTVRDVFVMATEGYLEALFFEYSLWTIGRDMLERLRVSPNIVAGATQVGDQVVGAGTLVAANYFTGQPLPPVYEYLGPVGAAVGGAIQAEAVPFLRRTKDDCFSPIEGLRDDAGRSDAIGGTTTCDGVQGNEGADHGNGPNSRADEDRAKLQALLDRKPADALAQIEQEAAQLVDELLPALAESISGVAGTHRNSDVEAHASSPTQGTRPPHPPLSDETIESIKLGIREIAVALGNWSELIQSGADKQQARELRSLLRKMEKLVNGSNANATLFAVGSALLYMLGAGLGTAGAIKGESAGWLGNKSVVATIFALTSTIAQAYANWAPRAIGGARPDDSTFVKLLKGGLAEQGSPMLEFGKNMYRAVPPLWAEFLPLQAGEAYAHSAGASGIPSSYAIRAAQEALRSVMTQLLLTAFGSRAGVPQVVGVMINVLAASAVVIMEREFNRG
jgi:hypothetical protein